MAKAPGKIGTAYVDVVGDFGPLHRQIEQLRSKHTTLFRKLGEDASRGVSTGLDRVRERTRSTGRDVDGLADRFSNLDRHLNGSTSRALRNVSGAITSVKPAALIAGLGAATQGLAALTAGSFAAIAALGPIAGVAAAAGNALTAAAQGAGVLALATAGIGDALKEQIGVQNQAAAGAIKGADQQRAAARAIEAAQEGVRQAREQVRQATIRVTDAERDYRDRLAAVTVAQERVRDAQQQLTKARFDARRGIEDVRDALVDATSAETRATFALVDARRELDKLLAGPDATSIADAHNAAEDAARDVTRAELDLAEQRRETEGVLNDPGASDEDKARARLALADAEDRVRDAIRGTEKAQGALNAAQTPATEDEIARARQDVADAEDAVSDALRQRTRAREDLNAAERAGINGSAEVVSAQRELRDAERDRALAERDVRDAARDIAEARRDVAEAERQVGIALRGVADAQADAASSAVQGAAAAAKLNEKLSALPGPAQAFVRTLLRLKPRLDELRETAARGFFPGATEGLMAATGSFDEINRVTAVTAGVLGDLAARAGQLIGSRGFGRDLETVGRSNARVIDSIGTAAISLGRAFMDLLVTAAPLTEWIANSIEKWAALKAQQTAAGRESGRLTAFFDRTREVLTRVTSIISSFVGALMNIGRAARPLGDDILESLDKAAQGFEKWTGSIQGQADLAAYFENARAPIYEVARLVRDLTKSFFRLGADSNLAPLIRQIRTDLLPTFERIVQHTTAAFGPALVSTLGSILRLIEQLTGAGGPLTLYVKFLGLAADALAAMIKHVPGVDKLLVAIVGVATAIKALQFAGAITGISALARGVSSAATAYRALAAGTAAATVAQNHGTAATAAARVAHLGNAAALKASAAAQRLVAATSLIPMYTQLIARLVAARIAQLAHRAALLASAAASKVLAIATAALNVVMRANPIVLVATAIAALAAGLVLAYRESETFRNIVDRAWATVKRVAEDVIPYIVRAINGVRDSFDDVTTSVSGVATIASAAWEKFGDLVIRYAQSMLDTIVGVVGGIVTTLGGLVDLIAGAFTGDWSRAWDGIKAIFTGVWNAMKAVVSGAWEGIKTIAQAGMRALDSAIRGFGSVLVSAGKWVVNRIFEGLTTITEAVRDAGGWVKNRVVEGIEAFASSFVSSGKWIVNRIFEFVTTGEAFGFLASVGGWVKNRIADGLSAVGEGLLALGRSAVNAVFGFVTDTDVFGNLASLGGWLKNRVSDLAEAAKDGFLGIGKSMVGWIVDGMKTGLRAIGGFVKSILSVIGKIPGLGGVASKGRAAIDAVLERRTGGTVHMSDFEKGARVTRPMVVVGEEAPRHEEYVIPTNPAYRDRALSLHAAVGRKLGVPGFKVGGIVDDALDIAGDVVTAPLRLPIEAIQKGARFFLNKLPGVGDLPDWLKATGKYVLKKATDYIKKTVDSLIPDVDSGGEPSGGGGVKTGTNRLAATLARKFGLTITSGYRDPRHNAAVGGAPGSSHTKGTPSNPGAHDFVPPSAPSGPGEAGAYAMRVLGAKWADNHDFGSGLHLHVSWFREGGIIGKAITEAVLAGLREHDANLLHAPFVGSYKTGGVIPRDGLAYVHAGETVTPARSTLDGPPEIHVYVGDRELTDIVRVEMREQGRSTRGSVMAGVRA